VRETVDCSTELINKFCGLFKYGAIVVVGETVVVGEIVVVVGSVVVVDEVVVTFVDSKFASIVYEVPYHPSGFPQQTPARSLYVPGGCGLTEIYESRPK
jgi:hypothetical protein